MEETVPMENLIDVLSKMIEICIHQREVTLKAFENVPHLLVSYLKTKDNLDTLAANLMRFDSVDHLK